MKNLLKDPQIRGRDVVTTFVCIVLIWIAIQVGLTAGEPEYDEAKAVQELDMREARFGEENQKRLDGLTLMGHRMPKEWRKASLKINDSYFGTFYTMYTGNCNFVFKDLVLQTEPKSLDMFVEKFFAARKIDEFDELEFVIGYEYGNIEHVALKANTLGEKRCVGISGKTEKNDI